MILSILENSKVIKTQADNINFHLECDVLVMGAGSAGVYAADSAARAGARVILCEIGENIGGMHVCGNVTRYYYGMDGGSFVEDDKKSSKDSVFQLNLIQWEQRQIRLTQRLEKSGVKVLCRCSATGLYFEDNRVVGICAFDGTSTLNISAKITVDATSDGHLIRMTDAEIIYGENNSNEYVPFTVRTQYFNNGGLASCNTDNGIMNHYNKEEFSKNTISAHANSANLIENGEFVNVALNVGIRSGLTFVGEKTITCEDVLKRNYPEKVLFWAYSDFDKHGYSSVVENELYSNWVEICNLSTVLFTIPVPFGCVVPEGIKGLVTAGRCLSCDTYVQSAVRMNKDMFRMGECVGIACALAVKNGVDFMDIDYEKFCELTDVNNCRTGNIEAGFYFDNMYKIYLEKMKSLQRPADPKYSHLLPYDYIREALEMDYKKNLQLLETDAPGPAIWSCFIAKDRGAVITKLHQMLKSAKDNLTRYNCAIALGLLNDERAVPVLTEIIENRDCFFFTDNRRTNEFRSVVAVNLMGRLGKEDNLPLLFEMLKDEEWDNPMYHTLEPNYLYYSFPDRNFVYLTMIKAVCIALIKIYKRNNLSINELKCKLAEFFKGEKVIKRITNTAPGEIAYEETQKLIENLMNLIKI